MEPETVSPTSTRRAKPLAATTGAIHGMVASSAAMRALFDLAARVAKVESTVLLIGESGVGKERIARYLHARSTRARGPFIAFNCGALTETLLESELFGHARGAFTGATQDRAGLFESANGGTLVLDEVGEVSPPMQVKLLRALQEREVRRVGESWTRTFDVRVIAATNRDLPEAVHAGTFREDLYYRLNVVELRVPALRNRTEDILPLARVLLSAAAARMGRIMPGFGLDVEELLLDHTWPGNVRELENVMERAAALTRGANMTAGDLPDDLRRRKPPRPAIPGEVRPLQEIEREYILSALARNHGNQRVTAEQLQIGTATLYRKLKKYRSEGWRGIPDGEASSPPRGDDVARRQLARRAEGAMNRSILERPSDTRHDRIDTPRVHDEVRAAYRAVFECSVDPQLITDRMGVVHDANAAARALLGAPLPTLRGRPLTQFLVPRDHATLRSAVAGIPRVEALVRLRKPDGSVAPVRLRGAHAGLHRVIWAVSRSAAHQSGTFEKPAWAESSEGPSLELPIEPPLSGTSHPGGGATTAACRPPPVHLGALFALLGSTRSLRLEALAPARRAAALDAIERTALTQAALADALIQGARIQSAQLAFEADAVDLGNVVLDVADMLRPMADAKGIELEVDVAGGLLVGANELRLFQVVINLLSNALKFTSRHGSVIVTAHEQGEHASLGVKDTGRGIPSDSLDSIFDPFVQHPADHAHGGAGLGLYIVKQLVELYGGSVRAESAGQGRGARFTVQFTRAAPLSGLTT